MTLLSVGTKTEDARAQASVRMETETARWRLGDRLRLAGDRGTVRFVGPIDGHDGDYLGIEWDPDTGRGKHDGCVDGKRLFSVRGGGKASCVKLLKVGTGGRVGFYDAVLERYGDMSIADDERACLERRHGVELVGMGSSEGQLRSAIQDARTLSLSGTGVAYFGHYPKLLASIEDLDLSNTLISSWTELVAGLSDLPSLRSLDVSGNIMQPPNGALGPQEPLVNLSILVAGSMGLELDHLDEIVTLAPNLEELYLPNNGIAPESTLIGAAGSPFRQLPQLRYLDLSSNGIRSWSGCVRFFAGCHCLTRLNLSDNMIQDLTGVDVDLRIADLNLAGNPISSWKAIQSLEMLPMLASLRVSRCPVVQDRIDGVKRDTISPRAEVIARLPALGVLNGSEVTAEERRECEMQYLEECDRRFSAQHDYSLSKTLEENPRFLGLIKRYDHDLPSRPSSSEYNREVLTGIGTLRRIKLLLTSSRPNKVEQSVDKLLPMHVPVQKLARIASQAFQVDESMLFVKDVITQTGHPPRFAHELVTVEDIVNDEVRFELSAATEDATGA